jgi:hypothetical protein
MSEMKKAICWLWIISSACLCAQSPSTGGPPFTITATAVQPNVKIGERATIHIVLKSLSQEQLVLPETRHEGAQGELNYRIVVFKTNGTLVPDTELGWRIKNGQPLSSKSVMIRYLNFGDEVTEDADLNSVAKITSPGDYLVRVERADNLYSDLHIQSNLIVFHVTP